ncbi:MBL fold metallo-hydrolase [Saccharomonospora xinjiangensis]|nr:hypothetical protein EYD13_13715 [Saccharomonospora xinjiangensis]
MRATVSFTPFEGRGDPVRGGGGHLCSQEGESPGHAGLPFALVVGHKIVHICDPGSTQNPAELS